MTRDAENLAWLRLARTENLGPGGLKRLMARFDGPQAIVTALEHHAAGLKKPVILPPPARIATEWQATEEYGARIIGLDDPDYPPLLRQIDDAPACITIKGRTELLHRPMLAMVGARNASANGRTLTGMLATSLAEAGWVIASGLARGIDTAAHDASLSTGTVAVIAGGIDAIYPVENSALYHKIATQGCVIAEGFFGQPPAATLFPRRNRIVAGLSFGVLVVEAALRSGSLVTAHRALDQGREVFAIPGSPLDPRCRGSNRLLKDGATLVEDAADLLCVLEPLRAHQDWQPQPRPKRSSPDTLSAPMADLFTAPPETPPPETPETILEQALSIEPVAIDLLIEMCALPADRIMAMLTEWELMGTITRHPGNRVSRAA